MLRATASLAALLLATPALASGFDWGADCDSGDGTFDQYIPWDATTTVGEIPAGKSDVEILLSSDTDVDVQLIDQQTGHEIIAWPHGDLNGPDEECTTYQGVTYCYSGYNGTDGQLGREWIRVNGATNRPLVMRAYGYDEGDAVVDYAFAPVDTCNEVGSGAFAQHIPWYDTAEVGDIPAGKFNVRIDLDAEGGRDVDVQLWDGDTPIIAWPDGLLAGPDEQKTTYQGMTVVYSGYNGTDGDWGDETIEIKGRVSRTLTMRAFGYQSGTADVTYAWGLGVGETCGGIAWLQCRGDLVCKDWGPEGASDQAGTCHTPTWCASDASAPVDCANLAHIAVPGAWTCTDDFTCHYDTSAPAEPVCEVSDHATYVFEDPARCAVGRFTCAEGREYFANECGCGCDCPEWLNCMPGAADPACGDLEAFEATCPDTQIAW